MIIILTSLLICSLAVNVYFLIGKFREQSVRESSNNTLLDGLMHSDKRVVLMTVLMTLAARVALKDGHVDDTEKAVLTSHLGLEKDKFAVSNAMFEEASKLPIAEDELVKLLIGIYPDIEERRKVIDFLMQIALADGEYHSNEQEYLEDLSRKLLK
jgi:tellurite resistance protein